MITKVHFLGKFSRAVDMIFVMGSSDPNGRLIFAKQKQIAKAIVDLPDTADQRYGVVQYDNYPSVPVRLGYIRDRTSLKEVVDRITWRRNGIAFIHALRKAADQFEKEGRPNADSVIVVFSDGKQRITKQELSEIGAMLRKKDITVKVVTTDQRSDGSRLKPLAPGDAGIVGVDLTDPITDVIISRITGNILSGIDISDLITVMIVHHHFFYCYFPLFTNLPNYPPFIIFLSFSYNF
jgi:hypothetical protein